MLLVPFNKNVILWLWLQIGLCSAHDLVNMQINSILILPDTYKCKCNTRNCESEKQALGLPVHVYSFKGLLGASL